MFKRKRQITFVERKGFVRLFVSCTSEFLQLMVVAGSVDGKNHAPSSTEDKDIVPNVKVIYVESIRC